mgnify:CR=1 FL=1
MGASRAGTPEQFRAFLAVATETAGVSNTQTDHRVETDQFRLHQPKTFAKPAPHAVAIDRPGQCLLADHHAETGAILAVGAQVDIQTGAALQTFETKNG